MNSNSGPVAPTSTTVRHWTSPAISWARCSCTIGAAFARAAHHRGGGVHRRGRSGVPRRARADSEERADVRRPRTRVRLPELRHPLDDEHRHRTERIAGCGADSRARSHRRARGDAPQARRCDARSGSLPRSRQSDESPEDHAGREPRRSTGPAPVPRGSGLPLGSIAWGPRIGINVGQEHPWRAWLSAHPAVSRGAGPRGGRRPVRPPARAGAGYRRG